MPQVSLKKRLFFSIWLGFMMSTASSAIFMATTTSTSLTSSVSESTTTPTPSQPSSLTVIIAIGGLAGVILFLVILFVSIAIFCIIRVIRQKYVLVFNNDAYSLSFMIGKHSDYMKCVTEPPVTLMSALNPIMSLSKQYHLLILMVLPCHYITNCHTFS